MKMWVGLLQACKEKKTKYYKRICSRWESAGLPSIYHHQSKDLEDPSWLLRLVRTIPLKRVGSWGMMLSFILKSFKPMEHMSSPSTRIFLLASSTKWNKALISVVFPHPVLPTTLTLAPSLKVQVISLRTNGEFGRYPIWNPTKMIIGVNLIN